MRLSHVHACVQVSVPPHAFPITYKYVITRENGDTELEVIHSAVLSRCLNPRKARRFRLDKGC